MRYPSELFGKHNIIGGAPRDIIAFCDAHEARSLDAVYLRACSDHLLLRKAMELLKTGGVLAIRFMGGHQALCSRTVFDKMMSAAFNSRWWLYCCEYGDVVWTRPCRVEGQSKVSWNDLPPAHYVDLLQRDVPFSFLRYNDGEWAAVIGAINPGPGHQAFTKELEEDLRVSLADYHRDPYYYMAMHLSWLRDSIPQLEMAAALLRENNVEDIEWVSAQTFNRASESGNLWPFIQQLQQRDDVIIVGPLKLRALEKLFPRATFVVIPATQCHTELAAIEKDILAQKLPAIILITAGPASKPLIHRLWPHIGDSSTMIDIGSMWAPYHGTAEHLVHFEMVGEIMTRNTGGLL